VHDDVDAVERLRQRFDALQISRNGFVGVGLLLATRAYEGSNDDPIGAQPSHDSRSEETRSPGDECFHRASAAAAIETELARTPA
jgi:hypothetical protein